MKPGRWWHAAETRTTSSPASVTSLSPYCDPGSGSITAQWLAVNHLLLMTTWKYSLLIGWQFSYKLLKLLPQISSKTVSYFNFHIISWDHRTVSRVQVTVGSDSMIRPASGAHGAAEVIYSLFLVLCRGVAVFSAARGRWSSWWAKIWTRSR